MKKIKTLCAVCAMAMCFSTLSVTASAEETSGGAALTREQCNKIVETAIEEYHIVIPDTEEYKAYIWDMAKESGLTANAVETQFQADFGKATERKKLNEKRAADVYINSAEEAMAADGSGATRIIPVMNVFTKTDVTQLETWIGKKSMEKDKYWWARTDTKIYDQYGLIAFIISLVFIYSCVIRHFFSIETLLYLILLGFTLGNIYYAWGCLMIMTGVTYFQKICIENDTIRISQHNNSIKQ